MQDRHECERCHRTRTEKWLKFYHCVCPQHEGKRGHWTCSAVKSCKEHRRKWNNERVEAYWKDRERAGK